MIECKMSLALDKNGTQKIVHCKAGESNARLLRISTTWNGELFPVVDLTPRVYRQLPDGSTVYHEATMDEETGDILFTIPTMEAGLYPCEVRLCRGLLDGSNTDPLILYSPLFDLQVEASIGHDAEAIPSGQEVWYEEKLSTAPAEDTVDAEDDIVAVIVLGNTYRFPASVLELITNRVQEINESADNSHYPTAKAVYDAFATFMDVISELLNEKAEADDVEYLYNKTLSVSAQSTDTQYPSAKAVYTALAAITPMTAEQWEAINSGVTAAWKAQNDSVLQDKENRGKATIDDTEYTLSRHTLSVTDGGTTTTYNFLTAEVANNGG